MKTSIKNSLLILLVVLLLLCYALLAMGSEDDDSPAKTAEQKDTPTASQSAKQTAAPQVTTEQATEPEPEADLEYCKRAAVTAMTNYCAFDGKTHSYSDTSGDREYYYMFVTSWGTWTQTSNSTYHVKDMLLRTYGSEDGPTEWDSTAYKFTLDVTYNATNNTYKISKVYPAYKEKGDYSYTNMDYCASHSLFTVPFSLIERDR